MGKTRRRTTTTKKQHNKHDGDNDDGFLLLDHVYGYTRHMTCAREILYNSTRPNFNYEPVSAASVHRQGNRRY